VTARTIPPGTTGLDSRFANAVPLASFIETAKVNKDLFGTRRSERGTRGTVAARRSSNSWT
jgi:hypothetical protein